jgi:hypothetical protein
VSVEGVDDPSPQPVKVEATRIIRASIDSNFLCMTGLLQVSLLTYQEDDF